MVCGLRIIEEDVARSPRSQGLAKLEHRVHPLPKIPGACLQAKPNILCSSKSVV